MLSFLMAFLIFAAPAGPAADSLRPGRYCAYDAAGLVSPPGDIRTIVDVEAEPRLRVSVGITWPHTNRIFQIEGPARVGVNGTLHFRAEDGWGNRSRVSLTPDGDLSFDLAPPRDDWASSVTFFYSPTRVGACRPEDLADQRASSKPSHDAGPAFASAIQASSRRTIGSHSNWPIDS